MLAVILLSSVLSVSCSSPNIDDIITRSEYGSFDYSLKPYFSVGQMAFAVYQNNAYTINSGGEIIYLSLCDLEKDLRTYRRGSPDEYLGLEVNYVCPVKEHDHGNLLSDTDCPAYINLGTGFLIDAHESNGSYPIIYYIYNNLSMADFEANPWERSQPFILYRYDTGDNTRKVVAEFSAFPRQMMAYGDNIYIVMQKGAESFELCEIDKGSGVIHTLDAGNGSIELISADESNIYFNNRLEGALYKADKELENYQTVFKMPETIATEELESDNRLGIYVNDGFIYYRADYGTKPMQVSETQVFEYLKYNIRRVPLSDPSADSEIVARDVFRMCEFGFAGNKLYYTPADFGEKEKNYYYNFNNGRLCAVDLTTLECVDIASDSGLMFDYGFGVTLTDRYIMTYIRPVKSGKYDYSRSDELTYSPGVLYDFETGALYPVFAEGIATVTPKPEKE